MRLALAGYFVHKVGVQCREPKAEGITSLSGFYFSSEEASSLINTWVKKKCTFQAQKGPISITIAQSKFPNLIHSLISYWEIQNYPAKDTVEVVNGSLKTKRTNSIKTEGIENPKLHTHLHIMAGELTKFQKNSIKVWEELLIQDLG